MSIFKQITTGLQNLIKPAAKSIGPTNIIGPKNVYSAAPGYAAAGLPSPPINYQSITPTNYTTMTMTPLDMLPNLRNIPNFPDASNVYGSIGLIPKPTILARLSTSAKTILNKITPSSTIKKVGVAATATGLLIFLITNAVRLAQLEATVNMTAAQKKAQRIKDITDNPYLTDAEKQTLLAFIELSPEEQDLITLAAVNDAVAAGLDSSIFNGINQAAATTVSWLETNKIPVAIGAIVVIFIIIIIVIVSSGGSKAPTGFVM